MAQITPATARQRLREIALVDVSEELQQVRVPVLYLRALHDRLVPPVCGQQVALLVGLSKEAVEFSRTRQC
jgi:pimeloyl-ACP methyl ester carboxylesterase